jgi:predicted DNA-binding transcriptional regulator AlpA
VTRGQVRQLKKAFLADFARTGNVSESCENVGIGRSTVYVWQEHDDEFAAGWREAEIKATEYLETEARRRATEGTKKPVYQGGQLVGFVTEKSDTLLIFLLKARAPEKYRENVALHHSGRIRGDEQQRPDLSALSLEELELYERLYSKATGASADA